MIGALAIVAIAIIVTSSGPRSADGVATIDYGNVVQTDNLADVGAGDRRPSLRIAVAAMISPKKTSDLYDDLLRLLADRVGRRAVFTQRKTYAEVNDMVERKEVDVAFVCSGPYVTGKAKFGMEILVVPVVGGQTVYHSYILTHRDSPFSSFDALKGKRFAFTDPYSNTGCLVPKYMVARRGETPQSFFGDSYYTYSHDNSIKAVAEGLADGAAVDSLIWEYAQATDPTYTAHTKIVEKSPPYGIPPVVVHPDLDPYVKQRLKETFLTLHEVQEAQGILRTLRIDRFVEGDDAAYDSVREMQRWIAQTGQEEP
ncbi:MAG: phosphate/phosphite/phosphonate ABC transporter substrate-binding protein [Planctomycetes bacterium]|nr:phosphate/phosphite/phosphonate ABC transporter substrate-binding protein [Planctomycetota bacterium]